MNLRWLYGNFADPQYKLTWADQKRLKKKTHHPRWPPWLMVFAVPIVPFGLYYLIPLLSSLLVKLGVSSTPDFMGVGFILLILFVGFFWIAMAWAFHLIYIKPTRRAMREVGFSICINCGYDLRGAEHDACPECGEEIRKGNPA